MGDKLAAKRARRDGRRPDAALARTTPPMPDAVGYPLLVKAAAGGGGKGMRVVETAGRARRRRRRGPARGARAASATTACSSSATSPAARHVEIQILGDAHGNVVHLGERECSIQRRHQKIVEESPVAGGRRPLCARRWATPRCSLARGPSATTRPAPSSSSSTTRPARSSSSRSTPASRSSTRSPRRSPGVDLVREQLRVAAGEPLGYDAGRRHLHRARHRGPSLRRGPRGRVPAGHRHAWPRSPRLPSPRCAGTPASRPARWSASSFDPMLAKVIAHAPTRAEAAGRLALALERLHLGGVVTNRDFLVATLRHPAFLAGDTTTDFIERRPGTARRAPTTPRRRAAVRRSPLWLQGRNRADAPVCAGLPSGWRNARLPPQRWSLRHGERSSRSPTSPGATALSARRRRRGGITDSPASTAGAPTRSTSSSTAAAATRASPDAGDGSTCSPARRRSPSTCSPLHTSPAATTSAAGLSAPMPGKVLEVRVAVGRPVAAGDRPSSCSRR